MKQRRNVILVTVDALRADHLSCYGYERRTSPNIDSLAKKGVLFKQAISNGPDTPSSFPSIHTSTYPFAHWSTHNPSKIGHYNVYLSKESTTIAQVLKENGYSTSAFVASNPYLSSYFNYNKGFGIFEDFHDKASSLKARLRSLISRRREDKARNRFYRLIDNGVYRLLYLINKQLWKYALYLPEYLPYQTAEVINERLILWLRDHADACFVWLHYMDVHWPYMPIKSFVKRVNAAKLNLKTHRDPRHVPSDEVNKLIDLYDHEVRNLDHSLKSLFDNLKKMGIWLDNSFIILTADHGERFGEHGCFGHSAYSGRPERMLCDELIRVPFILAGPGIKESTTVEGQVSLLDLAPTILDLLRLPERKDFQGRSLLPSIRRQRSKRGGVITEFMFRNQRFLCYRTERWKYVAVLDEDNEIVDAQLYNLGQDQKEVENLAKIETRKMEEFKSKLFEHISIEEETNRTIVEKGKIAEKVRKLKKLGKI